MGLFSSDKKYMAYAASSSVLEESPMSWRNNLINSAIQPGGESKAAILTYTLNTDFHARGRAMMRYAAREENGYIRGFPESNMTVVSADPAAVEAALTVAVGAYDSILYSKAGVYREAFMLSKLVQDAWVGHWDELQETITVPGTAITTPNTPNFLRVGDLDLGGADLRDIVGEDIYAQLPLAPIFDGKYNVEWPYTDAGGLPAIYSIDVDLSSYMSGSYFMVKYYVGAELKYWVYTIGSNVDPVFEAAILADNKSAQFLPVAVLMQDKIWFDEDPESEVAESTNKLLKKLATSGTEIKEDFLEQEEEDNASGNGNKSDAKKWDFFVHYAIPITSNVRGSKEYFWQFFIELMDWSGATAAEYYDYLASISGTRYTKPQPISELTITEAGVNGYNVAYRWSFIHVKDYPGEYQIPNPLVPSEFRALKPKEIYKEIFGRSDVAGVQEPGYQENLDDVFGPGTPIGLYDPDHNKITDKKDWARYGYHDYVIITKQNPSDPLNPEVPQGYKRMVIMGLSMQYIINTKDTEHMGNKTGYNFRYATPHLTGTPEETDEFRIPIQWGALQTLPSLHREEAVADGLTGTVFLVDIIKIRWYQTGFFKWLFIIIAIILIVISIWFPFLLEGAILLLGAVLGGSAFAMFVAFVIVTFAVGFLIAFGTSMMSPKMQMYLAIVIVIAMIVTGQFQQIATNWKTMINGSGGWMAAGALLHSVMPIYNMAFDIYKTNELDKLEDKMTKLELTERERLEKLQDAINFMGEEWKTEGLDPMMLVSTFKRTGSNERSDGYFARTLNANPGILSYTAVSDFAALATTLPEGTESTNIVDGVIQSFIKQRGE